ncbi:HAD family hydrolase [Maribacter algarum]|uniref:HAD family hydrolase n=1 Tax=Maribacter algarum (ex Zhang et al. 2020) TaxID=2578118 RepID=A0A5S3PH70_9FLAO|nr:HAD family hydrolase [Maribacter algarum]TMM53457.1 HAD family hydrolase [Maribacter algarum]
MDLSQVKMVVSDMDGTLLNSKHEVSNRFFELFEELQKRNILFVAASGRQYASIVHKLEPIKNDILVIAENGALVKEKEKELLVTPIQNSLKSSLLSKIDKIDGAHAMLCGKYNAYFDGKSVPFLEQLKEYYASYEIHEDFSTVTDEIIKIAVYHNISAENHIYPAMKDLEDQIKVKVSGLNWVDLNHTDANKGFALEKLQNEFGISSNETMVFGDYNNDLEMLGKAKYSFAMENAHQNVLKVANFKTSSNNDFGVERILEKLLKS